MVGFYWRGAIASRYAIMWRIAHLAVTLIYRFVAKPSIS
jgi:hypothetical protein